MSDDLVKLDPDVWRVQTLNINGTLYVKLSDVYAALENLRQFAESERKRVEKYKGGKDE